jgi:LysR family glycine cleavage system transcriptional activator
VFMSSSGLPPLNWLRAFEAAARCLSFTGAAKELNMTQSAVSQHIKNLEHFMGRAMFVRRTRSLSLTEAGESYLPVVQEAFATLSSGARALIGVDRGQVLSLQCNLAFSVFWLAPRLGALTAKFPWMTINMTTSLWERQTDGADAEIRFGRILKDDPNARFLSGGQAYPVAAPGWSGDWRDETLFDCSGVVTNWDTWAGVRGLTLPKEKQVHLSTTFVVSCNAALAGCGLAMSHDALAGDLIEAGRLIRPFDWSVPMTETYALMRRPVHAETPATRAFDEWLLTEISA